MAAAAPTSPAWPSCSTSRGWRGWRGCGYPSPERHGRRPPACIESLVNLPSAALGLRAAAPPRRHHAVPHRAPGPPCSGPRTHIGLTRLVIASLVATEDYSDLLTVPRGVSWSRLHLRLAQAGGGQRRAAAGLTSGRRGARGRTGPAARRRLVVSATPWPWP